ncbi:hypothetical protein D3C75_1205200 [compost metagenome]
MVQHLANLLDGNATVVHQPAASLAHGVRAELDTQFITYSFECSRYGYTAHRFVLGPVADHLKQEGVIGLCLPATFDDGSG